MGTMWDHPINKTYEKGTKEQPSQCCDLLSTVGFQEMANKICRHTPVGCYISVCFENGSAWVELTKGKHDENVDLPDATDKTLLEQINDALLIANGWSA